MSGDDNRHEFSTVTFFTERKRVHDYNIYRSISYYLEKFKINTKEKIKITDRYGKEVIPRKKGDAVYAYRCI